MDMSRNQWYWTLQITGWTLYALLGIGIVASFDTGSDGINLTPLVSALLMLWSTHLFRGFIKSRKGWLREHLAGTLLQLFPMMVGAALLINMVNSVLLIEVFRLFTWQEFSVAALLLYMLQTVIYYFLWIGIYLVIQYFRGYKQQEIEKWKLESAVKEAELIALKAQINPHFLFNSLNNIRALILEDPHKSRDMIAHLADLFRYSIRFNDKERVPLSEELEIVENYLSLESIHYEDRLRYQIHCDPQLKDTPIPPMVIQLLVENAIKHGISQEKNGGEIRIDIQSREDKGLYLMVSNTGKLKDRRDPGGIGIKNALDRIRLVLDKEPEFSLEQIGNQVQTTLIIPGT